MVAFDAVGPVLVVGFFVVPAAAAFLLSEAASYLNGVVLPVDGGLNAGASARPASSLTRTEVTASP